MATNGCAEVLNTVSPKCRPLKKQLGIATDLTEIATTIVVAASTRHSGRPAKLINIVAYLASLKLD